jgi:hypothetical protein
MDNEAAHTVFLEMPGEQAWNILRDLTLSGNYVPGITHAEITTDIKEGVGASRRVYPIAMDETVIEWREGHGFVLKLHFGEGKPTFPFEAANCSLMLEDGWNRTKLHHALMYTIRFGIVGKILDRLILNRIVKSRIRKITDNMKYFYETGESTNK